MLPPAYPKKVKMKDLTIKYVRRIKTEFRNCVDSIKFAVEMGEYDLAKQLTNELHGLFSRMKKEMFASFGDEQIDGWFKKEYEIVEKLHQEINKL